MRNVEGHRKRAGFAPITVAWPEVRRWRDTVIGRGIRKGFDIPHRAFRIDSKAPSPYS